MPSETTYTYARVNTPTWCLWAEPVLILVLAYCFKLHAINGHYGLRKMSRVAILGKHRGVLDPDYAF